MAANIYQAVKQAMQDLLAPQLEALKGEITALRAEMRAGDNQLRAETQSVLEALRGEMREGFTSLKHEMNQRFTSQKADSDQRFAAVGTELTAVRGELAMVRTEVHALDDKMMVHVARLDDRLTTALDLRERIVAIETKLSLS